MGLGTKKPFLSNNSDRPFWNLMKNNLKSHRHFRLIDRSVVFLVVSLLFLNWLPGYTIKATPANAADPVSTTSAQTTLSTTNNHNVTEEENWFYSQRTAPQSTFPANAMSNAFKQRENIPAFKPNTAGLNPKIAATWTSLGPSPTNSAGGVSTYPFGLVSGRVTALAFDAVNKILYAGSGSGGLWKSNDNGTTWTPLTDNQPSLSVGAIALDPTDPQTIYVGTGEANFVNLFNFSDYYGAGILKSTNGGATWTVLGQSIFGNHAGGLTSYISKILVDPNSPANSRHLIVGTNNGLFYSGDGGSNFNTVLSSSSGHASITDMVLDNSTSPSTILAGWGYAFGDTNNGLYRSTDGGASFSRYGVGYPTFQLGRISLAKAPSSPQKYYMVMSNSADYTSMGLYGSNDKGATWSLLTSGTNDSGPDLLGDDLHIREQGYYCNSITVDPVNPSIVYVAGLNIWRTTDAGHTFRDLTKSYTLQTFTPAFENHAIIAPSANTIYIGNSGGVYSSTNNGTNWNDINGNLTITQFYGGAASGDFNSNKVVYGSSLNNGLQKYTGNPVWQEKLGCDCGYTVVDPTNSNIVYTADAYLQLTKSTDGGNTWSDATAGINSQGTDRVGFVAPFVLDPTNNSRLLAGTNYVYETTNGARTWHKISPQLTSQGDQFIKNITALAVAPSAPSTIFAGTNEGKIWVTTNNGANWTDLTAGTVGTTGRFVTAFDINPTNPQDVIVTFSGFAVSSNATQGTHAYRSLNGGNNWSDISNNLPDTPVNSVLRIARDPNTIYLGTDIGFFFSSNGGNSWFQYQAGLPNVVVYHIFTDSSASTLFAATHGRGMFSLPLQTISSLPTTPFLTVSPSNLIFATQGANPPAQTVTLKATYGTINYSTNITYDTGGATSWLNLSAPTGTVPPGSNQVVTVNVSSATLNAGNYAARIVFTDNTNPADTVTVNIKLTVGNPSTGPLGYKYNLPFLANQANGFTSYLALQNTTASSATVNIDYYDINGTKLTTTTTTLAPNAEYTPVNAFGVGTTGTAIVTASKPLNVLVAEQTPAGGSAYAVGTGSGSQLTAPISINNSGSFKTQLTIYNSGSDPATATITFYNADGSAAPAASTKNVNINGHTVAILDQTDPTSGLPSGFYGWAQISGSAGSQLVGQILEQNPVNRFVAIANAETTPQNTLYAPAIFKEAFGNFVTGSNIVNPNAVPVTVNITYYDTNGVAVPAQPFTLGPRAIASIYQGGGSGIGLPATGLVAGFTGSAVVEASGGGIVMAVNEGGGLTAGGTAQSGTYLALASGGSNYGLPSMAKGGIGYYTGSTILNTSDQTISGSLSYFGTDGQPTGTTQNFQIAPHASQLVYQGAASSGLPDNFFGSAIINQNSGPANSLMVTTNAQSYNFFYTYIEPSQQEIGS